MSKNQKPETAVATRAPQSLAIPEEMAEIIRENLGTGGISPMDLDRIRVPTGGAKTWTLPDGESAKEVQGVIVGWSDPRAYWRESFDATGGGTPPDCASTDGVHGTGDPGGVCARCPMAAWGSQQRGGKQTRGQACRQMRLLFVRQGGSVLPTVVVVPPSSIKNVKRYFLGLVGKQRPFWSVVTSLTLEPASNKDGIKYSAVQASTSAELDETLTAEAFAYKRSLEPIIKVASSVAADDLAAE